MLRSETFRYSERMCRLLDFLVEHSLDRRAGPLKEYLIGLGAFDRPESFDPRTDPIVRVEVSRLRSKLRDYYLGEGAGDPVIIRLPKRGYQPEFEFGAPREEPPLEASGKKPGAESASSLAVLPFLDLSPDQTEEYFCDGITEELINTLARVEGLRIVPRTTVFQLKGSALDIAQIAERLRAAALVEGSVRRADDTIRISVQLVDAATGYHLWAETYERRIADIFAVQAEIATAIADALQGKLSPAPPGGDRPGGGPRSWGAYQHYLRGLHAWNRRTGDGFGSAIESLTQALREDPEYAVAWARLAQSHVGLLLASAVDPRAALPEASAAAEKALALAPDLAEAWAVSGFVKAVRTHQWTEAESNFLRAIELSPGDPTVHEWYAIACLVPQARFDDAVVRLQTAIGLAPASAVVHYHLGLVHHFCSRYDEAVQELRLALELEPGFARAWWDLGVVYAQRSLFGLALESLARARQINRGSAFRLGSLGYGYSRSGRTDDARLLLKELSEPSAKAYVSPLCLAEIHLALGDHPRTIACLEQAVEHCSPRVIWLGVDPIYAPLREDPAFLGLCRSIGVRAR